MSTEKIEYRVETRWAGDEEWINERAGESYRVALATAKAIRKVTDKAPVVNIDGVRIVQIRTVTTETVTNEWDVEARPTIGTGRAASTGSGHSRRKHDR